MVCVGCQDQILQLVLEVQRHKKKKIGTKRTSPGHNINGTDLLYFQLPDWSLGNKWTIIIGGS